MTPEELTQALIRPWEHGTHVDARGAALSAALDLSGRTICNFDLSEARLPDGLKARGAMFRGMAWLRGAEIGGTCDLTGATFRSDLRLDGLVCDRLLLDHTRFEGVLSLDGARLGTLRLRGALCLANLSLSGTRAEVSADLSDSLVMGGIWGEEASLERANSTGLCVEGRRQGI